MEVLKLISLLLTVSYIAFIIYYLVGWLKVPSWVDSNVTGKTKVSIVIAARNEELNIGKCLTSITDQVYPQNLVEVIVVDDFSTDATAKLVESPQFRNVKLIKMSGVIDDLQTTISYKKKALEVGVENASGDLIITTDADCIVKRKWLSSTVSYYEKNDLKLISGPVAYQFRDTFFEIFQTLDFTALIGIGGGAIGHNGALICNGANLAYEKKAFINVKGYQGVEDVASGDDVFLLHKVANHYPKQIGFVKSRDAVVTTSPSLTLRDFIEQRKRWVSKTSKYSDKKILVVLSMVYLFNLSIVVNVVISIFYPSLAPLVLLQLGGKLLLDGTFIIAASDFSKQKRILFLFLPIQLVHIFYVILIGIVGFTGGYKWKERAVK